MRNSSRSADFLNDILERTRYLRQATQGISFETFRTNETLILACERSIEIIGEAVKNLPANLKAKYPQVDWRRIAGIRDHLVHGYFATDLEIIWTVATSRAIELTTQVEQILFDLEKDGEP